MYTIYIYSIYYICTISIHSNFQDSTCAEAFPSDTSLPSLLASNRESISNIGN